MTDLYRDYWKTAPGGIRTKWTLPVETIVDGETGEDEYIITFPDELMEMTGWTPGTMLEWVEIEPKGSFLLRRSDVQS